MKTITLLSLLLFACNSTNQELAIPASMDDGIMVGSLESVGIDTKKIGEMSGAIDREEYPNIHSVLIAREGKLVFEKYFPGTDEVWGNPLGKVDHSRDSLHDVRSISKSVVSACTGIAISQGKIKSVQQRVFEFFPEYARYDSGRRSQLTIEHLLTMSSGIQWNEEVPYDNPENSEIQMIGSADPVEFVLSRPLEHAPGLTWKYNGGTTQLLAAILEKVSGLKVDLFAQEYLFKPLGITKFEWVKYPGKDLPAAASGLRLRSRDLLKFGLLYSNGGKWGEVQVVDQSWVEESMKSHISRGENEGYGYQFWIFEEPGATIVAAIGNGDQRIYFNKARELVVVVTAGNYNKWDIEKNSIGLMVGFVGPSME